MPFRAKILDYQAVPGYFADNSYILLKEPERNSYKAIHDYYKLILYTRNASRHRYSTCPRGESVAT